MGGGSPAHPDPLPRNICNQANTSVIACIKSSVAKGQGAVLRATGRARLKCLRENVSVEFQAILLLSARAMGRHLRRRTTGSGSARLADVGRRRDRVS